MAIIPSRTRDVPQVSFRPASKRPQRTIAFNAAVLLALADPAACTHVALDHAPKQREIRFVFLPGAVYEGTAAFKLISEGNTGRVLLAPKAQLDAAGIPYGCYPATIDKKKRTILVQYGRKL